MFPIRDERRPSIFPLMTYTLIALCTVALWAEFTAPDLETFLWQWALIPAKIDFGNLVTLYPLVTSIFLHGGIWHFFSNMWFLHIFGDNVEADLGSAKFVLFFVAGGVVAGLAQYIFIANEVIPVLGASGAIAAVLGYYFVKFPGHRIETLLPGPLIFFTAKLPARFVLFLWFATQLFNGTASFAGSTTGSGVAWWAHIGGFVFGVLVALLSRPAKPKQSQHDGIVTPDEIIFYQR